jgi:tetratricopeptide (TPR) repeat protein
MRLKTKKDIPSKRSDAAGISSSLAKDSDNPRAVFGVCAFLAIITFAVYGQTLGHSFQIYDDNHFVYENAAVTAGLAWHGVAWAFSHYVDGNWIPLTMISHMADCQFYHLHAGGHHFTNLLLHTASVVILFLVLRQMTGALWRSAFAGAMFAVHPLHVESVAWVAERKDVLSGLFFMLTLWAYVRYVRRPGSLAAYLLLMLFFIAGLMSKPTLVTLPLILLLLDYWPLKRFSRPASVARLILEKIPLFSLSLLGCVVTLLTQNGAIQSLQNTPVALRVENVLVSYAAYADQFFYPVNLSAFYPYLVNGLPILEVLIAVILLAAISVAAILSRQKHPYFLVGWLWFLVMLVPVIGIVQVGEQMRADRYTYLPQIGLGLAVTWLIADLCTGLHYGRAMLGFGAIISIIALATVAGIQTTYWRSSETLWRHALACTSNNSVADNNLGIALGQKGELAEAATCFQKAVEISPSYADAYNNWGNLFLLSRQPDEAIIYYRKALEIRPRDAAINDHLGLAYLQKREVGKAISQFKLAVSLDPDYTFAADHLHTALRQNR